MGRWESSKEKPGWVTIVTDLGNELELYFLSFECHELDEKQAPIVDIVHALGGGAGSADKVCWRWRQVRYS